MRSTPASRVARERIRTESGDPKVIAAIPSTILGAREAIQPVKSDLGTEAAGAIDQGREALVFGGSPFARFGLATFFDLPPGVIPPPTVVRGWVGQECTSGGRVAAG